MRVLITGDRGYEDEFAMSMVLNGLYQMSVLNFEDLTIIEGDAEGTDRLAQRWGTTLDSVHHITEPARWDLYGKAAGPIRNRKMYDAHEPDLVVAFHDDYGASKGTRDMVNYATEQGCMVYHVRRMS